MFWNLPRWLRLRGGEGEGEEMEGDNGPFFS